MSDVLQLADDTASGEDRQVGCESAVRTLIQQLGVRVEYQRRLDHSARLATIEQPSTSPRRGKFVAEYVGLDYLRHNQRQWIERTSLVIMPLQCEDVLVASPLAGELFATQMEFEIRKLGFEI